MEKAFKILGEHPKVEAVWLDTLSGEVYFSSKTTTCKRVTRQDMGSYKSDATTLKKPKK